MQIELDEFFDRVLGKANDSITKQAFFKSRKNIAFNAFKELFHITRDAVFSENKIKRYKGYRLFAIDGSELRLCKTKENKDIFSVRTNAAKNKSNARISMLYDVVSGFVIDAEIGSIDIDERTYAKNNLSYFSSVCNKKDIVIFDRGYPSKDMVAFMSNMNCKYLMRLQKSTFKGVSDNSSDDFHMSILFENIQYDVRIVRIRLSSGEIETLITNISEKEFKAEQFAQLYFMRWGIETAYNTLKNKLLLEKFAGKSTLAVMQEFFSAVYIINCLAALAITADKKVSDLKKGCSYTYRANRNLMVGYLKFNLPRALLFLKSAIPIIKSLNTSALHQPVPFIPYRYFSRPASSHQRKVFSPKYSL